MWLLAEKTDSLLASGGVTRPELAEELECEPGVLDRILDGKAEVGEETAELLMSAFGAAEMRLVIDWRRTTA